MTDKPTGVFVRLPLDEAQIMKLYNPKKSGNENLLAIGTPVTGGDMKNDMIKCFIPDYVLQDFSSDEPVDGIEEYIMRESCAGYTHLVRQSDALAKLAEKDAEIARLWSALDEIEMGIDALPDELECGDRMTAREMQRQALIIVKEEMKALKGPEA